MTELSLTSADKRRADESTVRSIPTPEPTKTWKPIAHGTILDVFEQALENHKIGVENKEFSLAANGLNMFAGYVLDKKVDGAQWIAGILNGNDTCYALTFYAGLSVIVCTNQSFSGEKIVYRKHTAGLTVESLEVQMEALTNRMQRYGDWMLGLKDYSLEGRPDQIKELAYDAVIQGIMPGQKLTSWDQTFKTEAKQHGMNMYAFYNTFTRILRDQSYFNISRRTIALNTMVENLIDPPRISHDPVKRRLH